MKSLFQKIFKPAPQPNAAALYGTVMAAARQPLFFEKHGLPDNFEGRFELLALHMFLVLERLKAEREVARALTEYMVDDLDRTLREMGIGDVGVAKRMKKMMSAFYGRVTAYDRALKSGDEKEILRALDRNLFGEMDTDLSRLAAMRGYIMKQRAALAGYSLQELMAGQVEFPSLREGLGEGRTKI